MKKFVMALALSVGVAFGGAAAHAKDWTKIVIATEGAYPPFNMVDANGKLIGFDVDIANALCAAAKVECEIVGQEWDGMIPGLIAKKYDAIIAQMSITEERMRAIDFTDYYATTPAVFVAKKGVMIDAWKDGKVNSGALDGKIIGVQASTTHSTFLEDNFPNAEVKVYGSQDNANLDLIAGRIDATLADSGVLMEWLKSDDAKGFDFASATFAPEKWFGAGAGIGVRKDEADLKALFNKALKEILANGTYEKINKVYFPTIDLHAK